MFRTLRRASLALALGAGRSRALKPADLVGLYEITSASKARGRFRGRGAGGTVVARPP